MGQDAEYNQDFGNCFDVHKKQVWIDENEAAMDRLKKPTPAKAKKEKKGGCGFCWILVLLVFALGGFIYAEKAGLVQTNFFDAIDLPIGKASSAEAQDHPEHSGRVSWHGEEVFQEGEEIQEVQAAGYGL